MGVVRHGKRVNDEAQVISGPASLWVVRLQSDVLRGVREAVRRGMVGARRAQARDQSGVPPAEEGSVERRVRDASSL